MNRLGVSLLLAASFFFLEISPATAHQDFDRTRAYNHGYQYQLWRHHEMPRWLRRDKHFRHWYRHTPLKRYRQIGWNQLFEIYRWERRYFSRGYLIDYDDNDRRWNRERRRYRDDD